MYALHASHQLIELPAYIVPETHIHLTASRPCSAVHTPFKAMQASITHSRKAWCASHLSTTSQMCILIDGTHTALHVSGCSSCQKEGKPQYDRIICACMRLKRKVWRRQGCWEPGRQQHACMHEMRSMGNEMRGRIEVGIIKYTERGG